MKTRKTLSNQRQEVQSLNTNNASYYLGLFTVESWREFRSNGGQIMGFNENKAGMAAKLNPGDIIICYITKVSTFIGFLKVRGQSFLDYKQVWSDGIFPVRLPVSIEKELDLTSSVPINSLAGKLSFLPKNKNKNGWTIHVRTSPRLWNPKDAKVVLKAISNKQKTKQPVWTTNPLQPCNLGSAPQPKRKSRFPLKLRVGKTTAKTEKLEMVMQNKVLGSYESVLSFNKVTGYSVNFPIAKTCRPTGVCVKTCYFAAGAPSWSNALKHQLKTINTIQANPIKFAERIALEYDSLGLNFLRWNGGGDLFPESIEAINYLGRKRPDIILWVVTRLPEFASKIDDLPNVFIHFSLDRYSIDRKKKFLDYKPFSSNYFFSYQCDKNEKPENNIEKISSVLFFDNYQPTISLPESTLEISCPLNQAKDIRGVCEGCRRCFNGEAVKHSKTLKNH